MAMERDSEGRGVIRLDGSMGVGNLARVTITTADKTHGTKDETFEFPYMMIDFKVLQNALDINYILAYRIEKVIPSDEQPLVIRVGNPQDGGGL